MIVDLLGNIVKVGDKVVVGNDWASGCDFLVIGNVENILDSPKGSSALISITHNGYCNNGKNSLVPSQSFIYKTHNRIHSNILILK